MERTYISVADTAKLVRKALKANFPGVKFSVRSKSYSGGASIDVDWAFGPVPEEVEKVAGRYAGADFDGMQDLMTYHDEEGVDENGKMQRVHYGADFIFCHRGYGKTWEDNSKFWEVYLKDLAELLGLTNWDPDARVHTNGTLRLRELGYQILNRSPLPNGYQGVKRTAVTCGSSEEFYQVV